MVWYTTEDARRDAARQERCSTLCADGEPCSITKDGACDVKTEVDNMAVMTMIESADGVISWECSECKSITKDKANFESKVKKCPKCGTDINAFHSLFDDDGEYL